MKEKFFFDGENFENIMKLPDSILAIKWQKQTKKVYYFENDQVVTVYRDPM